MPTIDEILDQIRTGDYSTPDLDLALTQLENEITQSRSAYGQGFFEQAGAGLAEAGTFLAELPYKALGMEPTKTNIPTKVPTGFGEKAGRFAGEVIPEIAAEAALVAGTGGVGGVLPLAGQIMGSAGAGALMGAREGVGSAAAGAGIGAAVPFGFNKLVQKFGRKAGAEVLDLGEEQLQEVLQRTAARAQDPNNTLPFEDLFMNEIGAARARQFVPRQVWPPVAPAEIDMTTGRLLPSGEVRQIANLMSGKVPAQLPPGDISFTTLRDAAATGHIPAFRNALAMAGQSQDEIEYAVEYLTKQPRGPKGRFLKPLSPDQRGAKYKEYLDELVGGRPAGNIPNVDVLTTAIRKTTENVPETVEEIVEDLGKLAPPEGVPPDVAKYLGSVQAKGADLTKMGERAGARKPFLKPAGVGQRTHVPNTIAQFDTLISRDIQASGVPKRVREAIMGVSRKPVPGVTPLTQAERVVLGKQLMDGKTTFAKKWINMMKQSTKKPKVAKKKAGFLDEKGAIELVPEDIKTDFSPLTGESGVLMLNRLTEYLNEDQLSALAEKLGVDHFKKKAGNILPLWYNALLMNPATMLRNLLGNTFEFAEQLVTRTAKGVLRASPRQALAQWSGFGHGLTNAFASAGEAWRTGLIKAVRTGEEEFVEELPSDITKYMPASKVMSWMDDFFTTLGYNMDLQDRIYRRAAQSSKNTMDEVIRMNSEVPEDLAESSMRAARRVVYRDFVEPGGFNHKVLKTIRSYQDIPFWGRFTLPFGRTPYMIGKRVVEYTPLNYFTGAYNIMAGGLGSQQAEQGIEQILRSMYGTAAMTSLYYLAKGGLITGEMQNLTEAQRDAVRASGVQPMSVKIGDQWITYRNLGPVSALFQFVGNTYEDVESGKYSPEEIAVKGPANLMGAAVDSTFLPELSNIVAAMTDPDRYGKRGLSQLTSYLQPITGVAALARAVDPKVREFDKLDPEQVFASKTPGLSQYLRPRLGLFGEELLRTATSDPGIAEQVELFVSPVRRKQISNDPVITEVARLQASMGAPSMDLKIESLTEEDKWVASKAMGMAQKQFVTRVMNSPFYARLPDDRKRAVLEKAHGKGRRFVNNRVNALSRQGKSITYRALLKGLVAE